MLCGLSLGDLGGRLPYSSLIAFLSNASPSSAYARAKVGRDVSWVDGTRNSRMLADLFDLVSAFRSEHAAAHGVDLSPVRYPRGLDSEDEPEMTIDEFDDWLTEVMMHG